MLRLRYKILPLKKGFRLPDVYSHKSMPLTVECPHHGKLFFFLGDIVNLSYQWLNANRSTKGDDSKTNYHIYIRSA
jgi:hypothetical protein